MAWPAAELLVDRQLALDGFDLLIELLEFGLKELAVGPLAGADLVEVSLPEAIAVALDLLYLLLETAAIFGCEDAAVFDRRATGPSDGDRAVQGGLVVEHRADAPDHRFLEDGRGDRVAAAQVGNPILLVLSVAGTVREEGVASFVN